MPGPQALSVWAYSSLPPALLLTLANTLGVGWLILDDVHIPKPYAKAITRRFYGGGPDGYNDFPALNH